MDGLKTVVMDLDGTLCTQESSGTYHLAKPFIKIIQKVNSLWTAGCKIVIFTARGMNTCEGNIPLVEEKYRLMTEKWLKDNRVCYDELKFGKPAADVYVDDKCMTPTQFEHWAK